MLFRSLHDRRKDVRQAALALLRRLPESSFALRWSERARGLVRFESGRLEIAEPQSIPSNWPTDGLDVNAPQGVGAVAWTLTQVVAFTPPSIWPLDMHPHVLASDWALPLTKGLSQAAATYADADWGEVLLVAWVRAAARDDVWPTEPVKVLQTLPPDRAEHVLRLAILEIPRTSARWLGSRQTPWSEDFSRFVVQQLPVLVKGWDTAATAGISDAWLRLDPVVLPEAIDTVAGITEPRWTLSMLERLLRTLELRLAMRREFE